MFALQIIASWFEGPILHHYHMFELASKDLTAQQRVELPAKALAEWRPQRTTVQKVTPDMEYLERLRDYCQREGLNVGPLEVNEGLIKDKVTRAYTFARVVQEKRYHCNREIAPENMHQMGLFYSKGVDNDAFDATMGAVENAESRMIRGFSNRLDPCVVGA